MHYTPSAFPLRTHVPSSPNLRWAAGVLFTLAALSALSCGGQKTRSPAPAAKSAQTPPAAAGLDDQAPILRTPWKGDLDEMAKRRVVRVLLPFRRPEFFYVDGSPVGVLQEAFQELERLLNERYKTKADNRIIVALLPTPQDRVRELMAGGFGDIAAFGISITDQNKQLADFTLPTMTGLKIVVVTGPGASEVKSVEDLSGKEVWVTPGTRLVADLDALNARLKSQGKPPAIRKEADPILEPGDIMEMVNTGIYPIAILPSQQAEFWGQVFGNTTVRTDLSLGDYVEVGWAMQKGTPKLKAFLDDFLKTHGLGTSFGNTLMRRYLKDVKYVRNAMEESEVKRLRATMPLFQKYASKYDIEMLMVVAQGYQESRLDQNVKSPVGAVGIMQVMPKTAAAAPVKIPNINTPENNIHAGVRLLDYLIDTHFNEPGIDKMNRTLFAFAAYNAGPAKITRCREMAKGMGLDPNKWFGNVEVAVAKVVGRETTQYVANIYKYYVAYKMARVTLQRRGDAVEKASGKKSD